MNEDDAKLLEFQNNVMAAKLSEIRSLIPDVSVIPLDKAFAALREIRQIIDR